MAAGACGYLSKALSNQQICDRAQVSNNTIKSFVPSTYRKIGVERRTQAILWAMANGFAPDTGRTVDSALRLRPAREK
jgi:NarL family two-component system response regulator LiaR